MGEVSAIIKRPMWKGLEFPQSRPLLLGHDPMPGWRRIHTEEQLSKHMRPGSMPWRLARAQLIAGEPVDVKEDEPMGWTREQAEQEAQRVCKMSSTLGAWPVVLRSANVVVVQGIGWFKQVASWGDAMISEEQAAALFPNGEAPWRSREVVTFNGVASPGANLARGEIHIQGPLGELWFHPEKGMTLAGTITLTSGADGPVVHGVGSEADPIAALEQAKLRRNEQIVRADEQRQRANRLGDECGALKSERDQALRDRDAAQAECHRLQRKAGKR